MAAVTTPDTEIVYVNGDDTRVIPGGQRRTALTVRVTGPQGTPGIPIPLAEDGEDSWVPGPPGNVGKQGVQGVPGPTAGTIPPATGEDGDDSWQPGPQGVRGLQGLQGLPGQSNVPGPPGDDGDEAFLTPAPQGFRGATGVQGAQGPVFPGMPGEDADDYGFPIPGAPGATGPQGTPGASGGGSINAAFTTPPSSWASTYSNSGDTFGQGGVGGTGTYWIKCARATSDTISVVANNISAGGAGGGSGWRVTAFFRCNWNPSPWAYRGLVVSDGTKFYGAAGRGANSTAQGFNWRKWNTKTDGSAGNQLFFGTDIAETWYECWVRVWDDTTNRKWQFSDDGGNTWYTLLSEARATFLTHTQVGFGQSTDGSTSVGLDFGSGGIVPPKIECFSWKYEDLP